MNLSQINKKLITIVGIVLGVFVIIFIVISVINKDRNLEFAAIEQKLQKGAEKYLKNNPELLPGQNGEQTVVGVTTLEDGKYIPMMSKMVKGETICNGEVRVSNNNGYYIYIPYLNCGNEYVTTELYKKITASSNIVTEDDGLYEIDGEYVFRGKKTDNFIEFAGQKWLIIKVDKDNHIKIIQYETKVKENWDNRYNKERNSTEGINDYPKSEIQDLLLETFKGKEFISEDLKGLIVSKPLCIGKRKETEKNKNGNVECVKLTEPEPIALIQANDFMTASLDVNCKETISRSCQNYNYLANFGHSWWTMTSLSENTHRVYKISNGYLESSRLNNDARVRAVLHLSENIVYRGGTGTLEDPYIVK